MALEPSKNTTSSSAYSTVVRQLDSSPSQTRRHHSLHHHRHQTSPLNGGAKHYSSIKSESFDANSTFDSCLTESCSKSEYSNSYYSQRQASPPTQAASANPSRRNSNNNSNNHNHQLAEPAYDKINKVTFDSLQRHHDPSATSKTVNNYFSLSEIDHGSESNSLTSLNNQTERPCDKYGFFIEDDEYESKAPTPQEIKSIRQREKKWLQMLRNWKYYINFKWEKIRDRCRKGIPGSLRSQAWFYLCGGHIQKRRHPHLFLDLLNKEVPEDVKSEIQKDLHRQFPLHCMFAEQNGTGQKDLFSVLKAFAAYKPKIGYCQAQGPIAAVLIMHMPAEHAFWSLVALSDYYIGGYFLHNLEEIEIHGRMLFSFLKKFSPNAYTLLKRQNIEPVLYMTEWFMCVYSRNLPWESVLRVWDMFLCEGVTVLFKVGIYLVDISLRNENTKTCPSMYETCQKLRNIPKQFLVEEILIKGLKQIDLKDSDLLREHKIQMKKHRKTKAKNVAT